MEENRNKLGKKISFLGIICNVILAVVKLLIGLASGMISIVADSVNNFSDAGASVISLVGFRLASKPADDEHPFGHARYEYISGLTVAFLVMLAGVELFKSSVSKIIHPEETNVTIITLIILALSIVAKLGMSVMYGRAGKKIDSGTLIAAAQDSRNDCISTAAVLISSIISYFTSLNLDGIMGLLVAMFVLYSGINLVLETIKPLIGTTPDPEQVKEIERIVMSYDGVLGTHDLIVHDYGPGHCFASVHVEVPAEKDVLECHELIDLIEQELSDQTGIFTVIHYDPIVTENEEVHILRSFLSEEIKKIDKSLTIHDLRIVPGEKNTNVIFDCVIPNSLAKQENEIVAKIKSKLKEKYPDHTAVVKVDHSFVAVHK